MDSHQQIFALVVIVLLLLAILELVRKRKIKEEYSWLWLLIGIIILILILWQNLLLFITHLIGAEDPTSTFFLFGMLFLILINIHYSIKISIFTDQIKKMAQKIGLIEQELKEFKDSKEKKK